MALAGLFGLALGATGCAGQLPFTPEGPAPFGPAASADCEAVEGWLLVAIAAPGYRVERAVLVTAGGGELPPEALLPPGAARGTTVTLGVGGDPGGERHVDATGMGVALGGADPSRTTRARFRLDAAGPPPWRLRVTLGGLGPVDILLDPATRPGGARPGVGRAA